MTVLLSIIASIIIFNIYHKIFNVAYFGLFAIVKEIFAIFLISLFIVGAILN